MDEEIDFLLLNPFAEIVEKAQAALDAAQAADNADMIKAAQALIKEGERARKAIEPIAKRHLALYGENFVTALKDHDGIAEHIDALNDLVYVFDDYTEPDSFDADKFKELGKTAQQTTLRITPILRRMKLEAPATSVATATATTPIISCSPSPFPANAGLVGISRVNSVGGHSTTSYTSSVIAPSPRPDDADLSGGGGVGAGPTMPSVPRYDTVVHDPLTQQPTEDAPVMGIQSGPDLGWDNGQAPTSNPSSSPISNSVSSPSPTLTRQSITPTTLPSILEPPPARRTPSPPPPPSIPDPPPPVPLVNPWQIGSRPAGLPIAEEPESEDQVNGAGEGSGAEGANSANSANGVNGINGHANGVDIVVPERRRRASTRPDSPTLPSPTSAATPVLGGSSGYFIPPPPPPTSSFVSTSPQQYTRRLDEGVDAWQQQVNYEQQRLRSNSTNPSPQTVSLRPDQLANPPVNVPGMSATWSLPSQQARQSVAAPTSAPNGVISPRQSQISTITTSTASSANGSVFSFDSYLNGLSNQMRDSSLDPVSPVAVAVSPNSPTSGHQPQLLSSFGSGAVAHPPPAPPVHPVAQIPRTVPQMLPAEQPGLEIIPPAVDIDPGLIPVDSPVLKQGAGREERVVSIRPPDCNIGPGSSFHLLKGFCEGAKEVQRGNIGVRKIKKLQQSYSGVGAEAAKCTSCLYELKWSEVDKDWQNHPGVNYRMHGIGFRLRFLSKCHLPAKQVDDPLYACIFCLQQGHTLEESDATVFFSQGQLFSHLARHPRPLPNVPGVTVVDGPELPPEFRNNYDLHFTLPPVTSELDGIRRELQQLPSATAIEPFRKAHGALRRPPDGAIPIQFPVGSKIVGIEFPAKYKGEWAVGWFDNMRGPFPAEHIRLDPPPRNEIHSTQGTSALRATVRWKWASSSVYRNSDWLRLDRNETVSNITWAHPEHWCWAGTNAKGKWGYFPQSHIEPNTLREGASASGSDAASVLSQERSVGGAGGSSGGGGGGGSGSLLSRFRSHNNHSGSTPSIKRPVSIASHSTSSSR
ncbi:hypothetical protein SCUCBS95973_006730 [Sporothrix curviconia]|uniref:Sh3 domain containing protein n=1 Tax=Sporothrix curviconia TaxID=1260050 RepID=A0ABP0C8M3_9PEZI